MENWGEMAQKWWTFLRCVGAFEVTPELYLPLGNYIERDLAPCNPASSAKKISTRESSSPEQRGPILRDIGPRKIFFHVGGNIFDLRRSVHTSSVTHRMETHRS